MRTSIVLPVALVLNGVQEVTPEARALVESGCEATSWRSLPQSK